MLAHGADTHVLACRPSIQCIQCIVRRRRGHRRHLPARRERLRHGYILWGELLTRHACCLCSNSEPSFLMQASLLGPTIAPLCGGIATHYASWRYAQWGLFVMGITALVSTGLWLPETLDPEKLNQVKAEGVGIKLLNPFGSLALLRSPNIFILVSHLYDSSHYLALLTGTQTVAGTTALITDFGKLRFLEDSRLRLIGSSHDGASCLYDREFSGPCTIGAELIFTRASTMASRTKPS